MEFTSVYKFLVGILVILPLVMIIHELGHAFFQKLFGGSFRKISLGSGKTVFHYAKIEVKAIYFMYAYIAYNNDLKINNKLSRTLIHSGGILFNICTGGTIWLLLEKDILRFHFTVQSFISLSFLVALFSAIPVTYTNGVDSDGKQIYQMYKSRIDKTHVGM